MIRRYIDVHPTHAANTIYSKLGLGDDVPYGEFTTLVREIREAAA
jgi:hypothetical protein